MKKILFIFFLLLPMISCSQKDEEEDISDLKRMVQAPTPSSEPSSTETPAQTTTR